MTTVGSVSSLWRYPVKSMGGDAFDALDVGADGVVGDRNWAVRDEATGKVRGAKDIAVLMQCRARYLEEPAAGEGPKPVEITTPAGNETLRSDDARVDERLSELLGASVALVPAVDRGPFFDALHLHLLTSRSLDTLAGLAPSSVIDVRRFRPNVVIDLREDAGGGEFPEQAWIGRSVRIGGVAADVVYQCPRCAMVTRPFDDLPEDLDIQRTIVRHADQNLGVYAVVREPGRIAAGDAVTLG